jgi:hypothetical protein
MAFALTVAKMPEAGNLQFRDFFPASFILVASRYSPGGATGAFSGNFPLPVMAEMI